MNALFQQAAHIHEAAVRHDEAHVSRHPVAHLQNRCAAHGKAVQNDLHIRAEALRQDLQPFQAVPALIDVIADQLSAALAGGGVVTAEQVKATAVVVVQKHTRRFRVVRAVAMNKEGDLPRRLFSAGEIKAAQLLAPVRADAYPFLRCGAQPLRRFVPVQGKVAHMIFVVGKQIKQRGTAPAENIAVQLPRQYGSR